MKENEKIAEMQEKKRKDEWSRREEKVQRQMNRMANTVIKDQHHMEKEYEERRLK